MLLNREGLIWLLPWIGALLVSAGISCEMTQFLSGAEMLGAMRTENVTPIGMGPAWAQLLQPDENRPCALVDLTCASSSSGGLAVATLQVAGRCAACVETFVYGTDWDRPEP